MRDEQGELHAETDEARAGSTPNVVRWVLVISLFAAIALLSIIWITGAATQSEEEGTVSREVRDRVELEATDSQVDDGFDELDAAAPGEDVAQPTVANDAAGAPSPTPVETPEQSAD